VHPLYIRTHPRDNVALIANPEGLSAGTSFPTGLTLTENILQSHKVALFDLDAGDPIIRYGHEIGSAMRTIRAGSWVREDSITLPMPPALDSLPMATDVPAPQARLEGYTFEGFRNLDGSAGTKNLLGIATTVQCVAPTVDFAVDRIKREILPRYPNVDGVVAITHSYGCGVALKAPGAEIPIQTLRNISTHANIGGVPLVVGLGCEKLQPEILFAPNRSTGLPVLTGEPSFVRMQDNCGFGETVSVILRAAETQLEKLNRRQRTSIPASELVVGLQCGGSDAFSGITANPAVGYAADLLVRTGATVIFSEVTEVRDAVHLLTPRAINKDIARALINEMKWYDEYLARGFADRSANPTPGNMHGGLSNVVEKSLGSIAKSGTSALMAVAGQGQKVTSKGLVFAATPANDFICGTQQLASMNVHVFTTGEGSPYGLAMVPVIKVSSRTSLAERWPDLIDIDAGRIATGVATIEEVGWEIFKFILEVASGRKNTWADHWGLHNAIVPFNPGPVT